jgi:hypothetical protein
MNGSRKTAVPAVIAAAERRSMAASAMAVIAAIPTMALAPMTIRA